MIFSTPQMSFEEEAALGRIQDLWGSLRFYVAEPRRWVGSVRRVLGARAIQGSNSIEGYHVSVEDAIAAMDGDAPADAQDENWNAVLGYRRAMTYVLQLAQDQHFEYTAQLFRSLHFMMTEYALDASPGLWRPGPIWVRNDATGDTVYEGPEAESIPALIEELIDDLKTTSGVPPLIRAAMAHLNLVMIHPFRDGNGRMSRCLQTLVLAREGIIPKDFSSIEEYLGTNTQSYYEVLGRVGAGKWSPANDASPWVRYCLQAHYIQAASVLRRVKESERMWAELNALRDKAKLPERTMAALFDATLFIKVRNSSYRGLLKEWGEEISQGVATADLKAMVDRGLLTQRGVKRGAYYEPGDQLQKIRANVRQGRTPIDASTLFDLS